MPLNTRGIQPLAWGTQTITGYVNESQTEAESTQEVRVEDEVGDVITQVTGFGLMTDVTLEVIPKTGATAPVAGDIFTYGSSKIVIISIDKKRIKKDVEKWTIKGNRFPGISLAP